MVDCNVTPTTIDLVAYGVNVGKSKLSSTIVENIRANGTFIEKFGRYFLYSLFGKEYWIDVDCDKIVVPEIKCVSGENCLVFPSK